MPETLDHIAYLSQGIGPRPAGTEEEQQAALYITEQLQKEAGLSAVIEDFNSEANGETPKAICCILTFIFTLLAIFLPIMAIPALIVTVVAAVLFVLEVVGRPIVSKMLTRGVSQNVVARYEPGYSSESGGSRRRKIILVANYDSGKVRTELRPPFLGILQYLQLATFGAMLFIPVLMLIKDLFFLNASGIVAIVFNVLFVIALILVALPALAMIMHKFAAYNEGANCNASGVAVLMDVARRIGRGRVEPQAEADLGGAVIHGEESARAAGLVPEGAQLVYEATQVQAPVLQTEESQLSAAKAAIAAMTGKPVPHRDLSVADNLVQVREPHIGAPSDEELKELRDETREAFHTIPPETLQYAQEHAAEEAEQADTHEAAQETPPAPYAVGAPAPEDSVPDWFKKAQENAKKPKEAAAKPIQRSRYADALDAAVAESSSHFDEANKVVNSETEERLRAMRDEIMEVSPPQFDRSSPAPAQSPAATVADEAMPSQPPYYTPAPAPRAEQPGTAGVQEGQSAPSIPPAGPAGGLGSTASISPIDVSELRDGREAPSLAGVAVQDGRPEAREAGEGLAGSEGQQALDQEAPVEERRPITLPDISMSGAIMAPIKETQKQRAPLAMAEEDSSKSAAKSLLNMLPSIEAGGADSEGTEEAAPHNKRQGLNASLPSMSGAIKALGSDDAEAAAPGNVSAAGSFVAAGATGSFAPVGDELLENVDPDDIYVDDADDSAYDEGFTETGAFAGPGYVEMPRSRGRGLFGRFRKGKDKEEQSAHEWLDVEEDFDARSAGAARGGWESFQQGEDDYVDEQQGMQGNASHYDDGYDDYEEERDNWRGGAFSRRRVVSADEEEPEVQDFGEEVYSDGFGRGRTEISGELVSQELRKIHQFRNPDFDTEIWFVALGSELANCGGMRAFLAEHEQDLRGSIIINIQGMGEGELGFVEKEGIFKQVSASSRMKRYVKKASQAAGVNARSVSLNWQESASSTALRQGFQAMSIVGMDGSKPAKYAQGDDVLENIDEEVLHQNTEFILELLKNI